MLAVHSALISSELRSSDGSLLPASWAGRNSEFDPWQAAYTCEDFPRQSATLEFVRLKAADPTVRITAHVACQQIAHVQLASEQFMDVHSSIMGPQYQPRFKALWDMTVRCLVHQSARRLKWNVRYRNRSRLCSRRRFPHRSSPSGCWHLSRLHTQGRLLSRLHARRRGYSCNSIPRCLLRCHKAVRRQ